MNTSQEDSLPFDGRIDAGVGEGEAQHSKDLGILGEGTFRGISPTAIAFDNFDFNFNEGSSDAWARRTLIPEFPNVSESHTISRTGNVEGGLRCRWWHDSQACRRRCIDCASMIHKLRAGGGIGPVPCRSLPDSQARRVLKLAPNTLGWPGRGDPGEN